VPGTRLGPHPILGHVEALGDISDGQEPRAVGGRGTDVGDAATSGSAAGRRIHPHPPRCIDSRPTRLVVFGANCVSEQRNGAMSSSDAQIARKRSGACLVDLLKKPASREAGALGGVGELQTPDDARFSPHDRQLRPAPAAASSPDSRVARSGSVGRARRSNAGGGRRRGGARSRARAAVRRLGRDESPCAAPGPAQPGGRRVRGTGPAGARAAGASRTGSTGRAAGSSTTCCAPPPGWGS
jgi:hypothetical protein